MGILVILFCLTSFLGVYFFGYKLGRAGVAWYASLNMIFAVFGALGSFKFILNGFVLKYTYFEWFTLGFVSTNWGFTIDSLGCSTALLVVFISCLIHLYSLSYMIEDPHFSRFMAFLSLFSFFMVLLVVSDNFLQFFLAWEGIGICSYLLISFWYTRLNATRAALEAVSFNRLGDFGFLFATLLIIIYINSVDFSVVFSLVPFFSNFVYLKLFSYTFSIIDFIGFFLFAGVVAKSAQLGLHVWLPDAMEGPTPVSALLHSSTMVVAGVFLLLRCSPLFEYSNFNLNCALLVGSTTAFFAASIGLVQHDLKKVIAYSTCSQLGYMVFACGMSAYSIAFYHVFNHAFFKSLLFLGAGSVIHALKDEQDMRRMGGLSTLLPFTYTTMFIGSLSLCGFPFLSGFYSKDAILESTFVYPSVMAWFCGSLGIISAFLTSFYSFRLLYLTFLSRPRGALSVYFSTHESDWFMSLPLLVLAVFSIFSGYLFRDLFIGFGTLFWVNSFFYLPFKPVFLFYEFIPFYYKFLPIVFSFVGFLFSYLVYVFYYPFLLKFLVLNFEFYNFFSKKWYFDYFWFNFTNSVLLFSYNIPFKILDQGWLQVFGPLGIRKFIGYLSKVIYQFQSGFIFHYGFIFVFSILAILFCLTDISVFKTVIFLTLVHIFFK